MQIILLDKVVNLGIWVKSFASKTVMHATT